MLLLVLLLWTVLGSWGLFRPDTDDVAGVESSVGHVVVFFFVSLAVFGLSTRRFGVPLGLALGAMAVALVGGLSEWLQPIVTDGRLTQRADLVANAAGIGSAVVASILLIALVRNDRRRAWFVAAVCAVGLGVSSVISVVGLEGPRTAWECRNAGLEPLDGSLGSPIIEVEDGDVRVGATRDGEPARDEELVDGLVAGDSGDLRCSVLRGRGYSITATVVPASIESNGPTRIFTSSNGTDFEEQNTHLGQEFDALSVRVRTDGGFFFDTVPGVFEAGEVVTIGVAVAEGRAVVFVDGAQAAILELDGSTYFDWDPTVPVLIGDELSRDRTFEGDILMVAVYDRALEAGDPALLPAG